MNIHQRINEVRKKVHYIKKDKVVQGQGYKAVTHDAVTAMVRNHLIEAGVVIVPSFVSSETVNIGQTKSGTPTIRYSAIYDIDFINVDDGDKVTVRMEAHANDHGDKAPGKAASYATKYAMLKLFSIETGEDEESRVQAYAEPLTEDQVAQIKDRLGKLDADSCAGFMAWSKAKRIEDIGQPAFADCIKMLDRKLAKLEQSNES